MTNIEKLRECFPNTIFIYRKESDRTTALMCSDEWLESEYKAPEQEPLYGDYVSREKVKEILRSGVSLDLDGDKDYVCDLIDKLPSRK